MRLLGDSPVRGHLCSTEWGTRAQGHYWGPYSQRQEDRVDQAQDQGLRFLPALLKFSSNWGQSLPLGGRGVIWAPRRASCLADPSLYPAMRGSNPHNARAMLGGQARHVKDSHEPWALRPLLRPEKQRPKRKEQQWDLSSQEDKFPGPAGARESTCWGQSPTFPPLLCALGADTRPSLHEKSLAALNKMK